MAVLPAAGTHVLTCDHAYVLLDLFSRYVAPSTGISSKKRAARERRVYAKR